MPHFNERMVIGHHLDLALVLKEYPQMNPEAILVLVCGCVLVCIATAFYCFIMNRLDQLQTTFARVLGDVSYNVCSKIEEASSVKPEEALNLVERECKAAIEGVHERIAGVDRRLHDMHLCIGRLEQTHDSPSPAIEELRRETVKLMVDYKALYELVDRIHGEAEQEKENVGILLSELRKSLDFTIKDYVGADRSIASNVDALKQTLGNKLTMVGERQNEMERKVLNLLSSWKTFQDAIIKSAWCQPVKTSHVGEFKPETSKNEGNEVTPPAYLPYPPGWDTNGPIKNSAPVLRRPAGWGKSWDRSKNEGNVASPQTYPDNWDVPGLD